MWGMSGCIMTGNGNEEEEDDDEGAGWRRLFCSMTIGNEAG
jgi:hypothetical protein